MHNNPSSVLFNLISFLKGKSFILYFSINIFILVLQINYQGIRFFDAQDTESYVNQHHIHP